MTEKTRIDSGCLECGRLDEELYFHTDGQMNATDGFYCLECVRKMEFQAPIDHSLTLEKVKLLKLALDAAEYQE